jgi:hypothetical protein
VRKVWQGERGGKSERNAAVGGREEEATKEEEATREEEGRLRERKGSSCNEGFSFIGFGA